MAVPISATNSTGRSISQHGMPERSYSGNQRKLSDSFFSSLFSSRKLRGKTSAGSCSELPKSSLSKFYSMSSNVTGAEAKPPTGNRRAVILGCQGEGATLLCNTKQGTFSPNTISKKISLSAPSSPMSRTKLPKINEKINPNTHEIKCAHQKNKLEQERQAFIIPHFIRRSLGQSKFKLPTLHNSPKNNDTNKENNQTVEPPSLKLTFAQRIRLHKGLRTGNVPVELLSKEILRQKERLASKSKVRSDENRKNQEKLHNIADNIDNTTYLVETLFALSDTQPIVARSMPKMSTTHPNFEWKRKVEFNIGECYKNKIPIEGRLQMNCIFEPNVYDEILINSLDICDQLQLHLAECINGVRARSSTALSSPFSSQPTTPILARSRPTQNHFNINSPQNINDAVHCSVLSSPCTLTTIPSLFKGHNCQNKTTYPSPAAKIFPDEITSPLQNYSYYTDDRRYQQPRKKLTSSVHFAP